MPRRRRTPEPTATELAAFDLAQLLGNTESHDVEPRVARPNHERDLLEELGISPENGLPTIPSGALRLAIGDALRAVREADRICINTYGSSVFLWARNRQLARLVELPWLPYMSCSILAGEARLLARQLREAGELDVELSATERLWSLALGSRAALVSVLPGVPLPDHWDCQSTVDFDPEAVSTLACEPSDDPVLLYWHPEDGLRIGVQTAAGFSSTPTVSWSGPAQERCWQVSRCDLRRALTPAGPADWRFALAATGGAFVAERHQRLAGSSCRVLTVLALSPHALPPRHETPPSNLDVILSELCQ